MIKNSLGEMASPSRKVWYFQGTSRAKGRSKAFTHYAVGTRPRPTECGADV